VLKKELCLHSLHTEEKLKTVREVHIKLASRLGAKLGVQLSDEEFVKSAAKFAANEKDSRACLKEVTCRCPV